MASILLPTDSPDTIDSVYWTIDDELDFIEFKKSKAQKEQESKLNAAIVSKFDPDKNAGSHIKYLLASIEKNNGKNSTTQQLIDTVLDEMSFHGKPRPLLVEKNVQQEWYDACDSVVNDLKNYTEHSVPFLNKVSKRDAPDYFTVIKNPMDLGTVHRKLKGGQYRTTEEFSSDLFLIYSNCIAYNTEPGNVYITHANEMRKKTIQLLQRIPDLNGRERSEYDPESDMDSERESVSGSSTRLMSNLRMVQSKKWDDLESEDDIPQLDALTETWMQYHLKSTTCFFESIINKNLDDMPFEEQPSIFRSSDKMRDNEVAKRKAQEDGIPYLPEYVDLDSSIPDSFSHLISLCDKFQKSNEKEISQGYYNLEKKSLLQMFSSVMMNGNLCRMIKDNIEQLRKVRTLFFKITEEKLGVVEGEQDIYQPCFTDTPLFFQESLTTQCQVTGSIGKAVLKRMNLLLLLHSGFEGAHPSTFVILDELIREYTYIIGKSFRTYFDTYGKVASPQKILSRVMQVNGMDCQDLMGYINDEIIKRGVKLKDTFRRMEQSILATVVGEDVLFEEGGSDRFAMGAMPEEFCEDYFGFKSLGLSEEFGSAMLKIPARLFFGRKDASSNLNKAEDEKNEEEYPAPGPFRPLTSASKVIGLLKEFFSLKLEQNAIEDEFQKPQKRKRH